MHRLLGPVSFRHGGMALATAAVTLLFTTACQAGPDAERPEETARAGDGSAEPAPDSPARIATVTDDSIDVYTGKGGGEVLETLESPNGFGAERTFLVEREEEGWLEVLLPIRPNGTTGWVRAADVELTTTSMRVEIDLDAFEFSVYDGAEEVRSGEIGTGAADTPTPPGRYYVTELLRPLDPEGGYGAYVFGLSGFSPTLETFAGGPGQLAVHGTDDEGSLGREDSHGCVRVSNEDVTWMAGTLPLGTPVEITE